MSSDQWEVVGKIKKEKPISNGKPNQKYQKDDRKKFVESSPKLEDVLPPAQLKSLYASMENGDDKKLKEKKKDNESKKQQKKQQSEKKTEPPKPKPPKSVEAALRAIDSSELVNIISSNKSRFSNAPLVWLKEVANFLNSKTPVEIEDTAFSNQPSDYPLGILPSDIKKTLDSVLKDSGEANLQIFFDVTLTTMANDMSRGQSVIGHKLLLQILAQDYPEFCVSSLPKSLSLWNSYQNRPPIGLSLLWAFGQGGFKNLSIGLQAWQELFVPALELRNYSKYVVLYLKKLLETHGKMESPKISQDQFLSMVDLVSSKRKSLSKELSSDLIKQLVKVKELYLSTYTSKLQVTFNQLMKRVPQTASGDTKDLFEKILLDSLIQCLVLDDSCNATWRQLFLRCNKQSLALLQYIDLNWKEFGNKLNQNSLRATLKEFKELDGGDTLKGKKKDDTMVKTTEICEELSGKMRSTKKGFPWLRASAILLFIIGGIITYDVSRFDWQFQKSSTSRLLSDLGILEQSQKAWQKTLSTSARGYIWMENNAPIYYEQASVISKPYLELARDLYVVVAKQVCTVYGNTKEYVIEKGPVIYDTVEKYAPGLIDNVKNYASAGWAAVCKYSTEYYDMTAEYMKTKVFVGEWAPEILQNRTQTALNATRFHVTTYLHWLRKQVHIYSEIP